MSIVDTLHFLKELIAIIGPILIGIYLLLIAQDKLNKSYQDTIPEGEKESRIILLRANKNISILITLGGIIIILLGIFYLINVIP